MANNQYAATNTNVVKLCAILDRVRNDQLSYFQPGIGVFPQSSVVKEFGGAGLQYHYASPGLSNIYP